VHSLPASWTDVEGPDPFLVIAAGRAHFRAPDLLALADLLRKLASIFHEGCRDHLGGPHPARFHDSACGRARPGAQRRRGGGARGVQQ